MEDDAQFTIVMIPQFILIFSMSLLESGLCEQRSGQDRPVLALKHVCWSTWIACRIVASMGAYSARCKGPTKSVHPGADARDLRKLCLNFPLPIEGPASSFLKGLAAT